MALPLTAEQQAYIDLLASELNTFKSALVSAIKADNDPSHNLGDARDRGIALDTAAYRIFRMLTAGGAGMGAFYGPTDSEGPSLPRSPASRGFISAVNGPETGSGQINMHVPSTVT